MVEVVNKYKKAVRYNRREAYYTELGSQSDDDNWTKIGFTDMRTNIKATFFNPDLELDHAEFTNVKAALTELHSGDVEEKLYNVFANWSDNMPLAFNAGDECILQKRNGMMSEEYGMPDCIVISRTLTTDDHRFLQEKCPDWPWYAERVIEFKTDKQLFETLCQGQAKYYCLVLKQNRPKDEPISGCLMSPNYVVFLYISDKGKTLMTKPLMFSENDDYLKLVLLMTKRAGFVKYVNVEEKQSFLSISNTTVVAKRFTDVVKLPLRHQEMYVLKEIVFYKMIANTDLAKIVVRVDELCVDGQVVGAKISPVMTGDLTHYIENGGDIGELVQVIDLLRQLHRHGYGHNDLRIDNVLYVKTNGTLVFKLSDFAFYTKLGEKFDGGAVLYVFAGATLSSRKLDVGVFLSHLMEVCIGDPYEIKAFDHAFAAVEDGENVYDFAKKWIREIR